MKTLARFLAVLVGIAVTLAVVVFVALAIDERLSRQLDDVDITWEEVAK